jgi:NADH:ubiquinone oxidoreductase subunit 6 (subunit J)
MFARIFGKDIQEQVVGVAIFVIAVCMLIVFAVIIVSPLLGDKKSETTISIEIVKVLIGLVSTAFGFLVGNMSKKNGDDKD